MSTPPSETATAPARGLTLAMALATGVAVANIYYNQPMLGVIAQEFKGSALTGLIPTATQLGYAVGLFLLVPLSDVVERRGLIVWQLMAILVGLAAAALAPSVIGVVLASLLIGVCASAAQQIVPFAAHLSPPEKRGATVGTVMSGLLCGILLSRTLSGFVAAHAGWREMFWLAMPMAAGVGLLMRFALPKSKPPPGLSYGVLLGSLGRLWREFPELRRSTYTQAALFCAFNAFWTILALHLQEPRFGLGPDAAGLFGVLGVSGVLAAPVAGRIADRRGPRLGLLIGALLSLAGWLVFGLWVSVPGLILGVLLLDFGVQGALVSNQHVIYALRPEARGRLNTLFMGVVFLGGAAGSAAASATWAAAGWTGVSWLAGAFSLAAVLLQLSQPRRRPVKAAT